jgi:hypothetical protein
MSRRTLTSNIVLLTRGYDRQANGGSSKVRPRFMLSVLNQPVAWEGCFSVTREGQLRVVPLS